MKQVSIIKDAESSQAPVYNKHTLSANVHVHVHVDVEESKMLCILLPKDKLNLFAITFHTL